MCGASLEILEKRLQVSARTIIFESTRLLVKTAFEANITES